MMLWQQVLSNMLHDNAVPHCKLHSVSVLFGAQYWACVGLHLLPTDKDFARLTQSLAVKKAMFHTISGRMKLPNIFDVSVRICSFAGME